jgi:nucleoside-diphosphate-sugar epimerase
MKKVLLTGAAGFIGYHFSDFLLRKGFEVYGIDDLNDNYDKKIKQWRISQLISRKNFHFNKLDISSPTTLKRYFRKNFQSNKLNAIVNLAARTGVRKSTADPYSYYQSNVMGVLNLIQLANTYGIQNFIHASTSSVYGGSKDRSFNVNADTNKPLSNYAASKKASEALLYAYHMLHGQNISILRFFTVYGPAGRPDMSPFVFIQSSVNSKTINLFGTGRQKRDFTYVDDVVSGIYKSLKLKGYNVLNLGNNKPISINYLIDKISELSGKKTKIRKKPLRPEDVFYTCANITKTKKLIGWTPKTNIDQGLTKTLNWHLENQGWLKKIKIY